MAIGFIFGLFSCHKNIPEIENVELYKTDEDIIIVLNLMNDFVLNTGDIYSSDGKRTSLGGTFPAEYRENSSVVRQIRFYSHKNSKLAVGTYELDISRYGDSTLSYEITFSNKLGKSGLLYDMDINDIEVELVKFK